MRKGLRGYLHRKNGTPAATGETTTVTTQTTIPESQSQVLQTAPMMAETRMETVELPKEIREKPAIIHEKIRREEVEEIQPVIHRERDTTELRQLTQPIYEQDVKPIQMHEQILAAEQRPTIVYPVPMMAPAPLSTSEFAGVERKVIEKPAVLVETIRRHVIEEVQPVIYREIHEPHIIRVTKPIYEKVVEAPLIVQQTLVAKQCVFTPQLVQYPLQREEVTTTTTTTPGIAGTTSSTTTGQSTGFHGHHHHGSNVQRV